MEDQSCHWTNLSQKQLSNSTNVVPAEIAEPRCNRKLNFFRDICNLSLLHHVVDILITCVIAYTDNNTSLYLCALVIVCAQIFHIK